MSKLRSDLIKKLERIPGLEDRPSKVAGGSAIFYKDKEIASEWIEIRFQKAKDVDEVVRLFKLALEQYR